MVLPIIHLAMRAAESGDVVAIWTSSRVLRAMRSTLWLAAVVTVIATALGVAIAWLLERTDIPGARILGVVAAVPLVVPSYVAAVAIRDAFGPRALVVEVPGIVGFRGAAFALA